VLLLEGSYFLQLNVEEVLVILLYEVLSLLLLLLEDGFIFLSRFSILKKASFENITLKNKSTRIKVNKLFFCFIQF